MRAAARPRPPMPSLKHIKSTVTHLLRRGTGRPADAAAFPGSAAYWNQRYVQGGDSGVGSYGRFAAFKARVLNQLFVEHGVHSVVEFGCGDGNQLASLVVDDYLGVDVSPEAIARCRARFAGAPGRAFVLSGDYDDKRSHDAALSLDVVYHLTEDVVFESYMRRLFSAASKLVVVYSSNHEDGAQRAAAHVRHREFTRWVAAHAPGWRLQRHIPNEFPYKGDYRQGSFADFHVFVPAG